MPSSRVLVRFPLHVNRSPEAARHSTIVPLITNADAMTRSACFDPGHVGLGHVGLGHFGLGHVGLAWLLDAKVSKRRAVLNSNEREA